MAKRKRYVNPLYEHNGEPLTAWERQFNTDYDPGIDHFSPDFTIRGKTPVQRARDLGEEIRGASPETKRRAAELRRQAELDEQE